MDKELKEKVSEILRSNPKGTLMDLVLSDVLAKHGISERALRNLSYERRSRIKQIYSEIQSELRDLLD